MFVPNVSSSATPLTVITSAFEFRFFSFSDATNGRKVRTVAIPYDANINGGAWMVRRCLAPILQNIEPRIVIGDIGQTLFRDPDVAGLDHIHPVGAFVHQFGWFGRHEGGDLFGLVFIGDVIDPYLSLIHI